jgi:hypothetical protein
METNIIVRYILEAEHPSSVSHAESVFLFHGSVQPATGPSLIGDYTFTFPVDLIIIEVYSSG